MIIAATVFLAGCTMPRNLTPEEQKAEAEALAGFLSQIQTMVEVQAARAKVQCAREWQEFEVSPVWDEMALSKSPAQQDTFRQQFLDSCFWEAMDDS